MIKRLLNHSFTNSNVRSSKSIHKQFNIIHSAQPKCYSSSSLNSVNAYSSSPTIHIHENKFYTGEQRFHLVVLNTPYCSYPLFAHLYKLADSVVCADGGANQLFDTFHKDTALLTARLPMPNYICGDLDSVRPEVVHFYETNKVKVVQLHDQDYNDLQKSLDFVMKQYPKSGINTILIYGAGGRLDQEMCNLNALYSAPDNYRFLMISPFSCSAILKPGTHILRRNKEFENKKCALVPLGKPCWRLDTQGLRWNINHSDPKVPAMQFGGLVSTSNEFDVNNEVHIDTSDELLWNWTLKR